MHKLAHLLGVALGIRDYQRQLSVCAIFKNEAPYLDDWLAFHSGVGVDHFFLYNNESDDNFLDVLAPWIEAKKVTLTDWPGRAVQATAYNHCLELERYRSRWIAFIDLDEYLFSPTDRVLPKVLESYADVPAIFVYWWLYGSSGNVDRPSRPVVEACTRRFDFAAGVRADRKTTGRPDNGKSIVNPRKVRRMGVHLPILLIGKIFDEQRRPSPLGSASPERHSTNVLRINHYWARSIRDLRDKAARGRASNGKQKQLEQMLEWDRHLNAIEDKTILPIWRRILDLRSIGPSPKTPECRRT